MRAGDWNTNIWSAGEPLTIIRAAYHLSTVTYQEPDGCINSFREVEGF